jgi:hypothetical protein
MNILQKIIILSLSLTACNAGAQSKLEGIGYPTVETALQALKSNSANKVSVTPDDWIIVSEGDRRPLWSFTPRKHPAHPAAVKRTLVERNGSIVIEMSALCQASKSACDGLMEEFKLLNERISQEVKAKSATAAAFTDSPIDVETLDKDSFRLVLKSKRSATVDAGQVELMSKAKALCGMRAVSLGKYQFDLDEPLIATSGTATTLVLKQDIRCLERDAATEGLTPSAPATKLAQSALEDQRAESATLTYLSLIDGAKYKEAYIMQSEMQRKTEEFTSWRARVRKFHTTAGAMVSRKIKKVTWYLDPPGIPPGKYAAVDFLSAFENIPYYCGYVVWREEADALKLVREEVNIIDADMVKTLNPEQLEAVIARFKCR